MKKGIDYIGVGIGAVIINTEGKIFLSLRGKGVQNEMGKWECPGGGVEFGETMKETIVREIKEEFGFVIEPLYQMAAVDHFLPDEKQHWIAISYICKVKSGKPRILEPEKSEKIGWFSLEEMEKLSLTIPARHRLKELKTRFKNKLSKLYSEH